MFILFLNYSIVDMFERVHEISSIPAFTADSPYPYIHTSIISHHIPGSHTHIHPRWNDDRFAGSTIMYSFAAALSMARRIHGVSEI